MDDSRLTILQMRLDGIAQAMQDTLFRCAVSPVVREGNDAAAALMAADGELLALSDAIPLLLGALQGSVEAILSHYPADTMRSGDLYFMNDPYSGGTHLPDITVVMPVFAGPALIGLAATILHHQDVGGTRAGSVPPDAVEIFQEGLRLPPMRLGQGGAVDPAIKRLTEANSRARATVLGDIGAQIAAANRAAE
ncbi:MAG: hydantoinase B/oxoprolinase family protein, partial [Nitratireductor sp.]